MNYTPVDVKAKFAIWQKVYAMKDNKVVIFFVYRIRVNGERESGRTSYSYDLVQFDHWKEFRYEVREMSSYFNDYNDVDVFGSKEDLLKSL